MPHNIARTLGKRGYHIVRSIANIFIHWLSRSQILILDRPHHGPIYTLGIGYLEGDSGNIVIHNVT